MSFVMRMDRSNATASRVCATVAIAMAGTLLAGCSTNIARLENPPPVQTADKAPTPSASIYNQRSGTGGPVEPNSWPNSGARGPLPPPAVQSNTARVERAPDQPPPLAGGPIASVNPSVPFDAPKAKSEARGQAPAPSASGTSVEVQPGDTLYGLSKKHRVPISALMSANGLKSADLKPGQKLVIPAGGQRPHAKAERLAEPQPSAQPKQPAAAVRELPQTDWSGTHTVKSGESLYGLSRTYKVSLPELQRVNGVTDPTKVRPGTVLKVPGTGAPTAAAPATVSDAPATVGVPAWPAGSVVAPTRMLNGPAEQRSDPQNQPAPAQVASTTPPATEKAARATQPAAANAVKFRWPVRGKTLAEFGKRPDGTHNDGINIAVPLSTEIAAAEAGTVAYAGSELKGYGNLVLVRHDNGWVTAYAHADQILVKRGDSVKRGQTIARAGSTGTVDQPQVHFELRQGSKPVDPMPYMEK
jgi:murein DD-endopeptidase MepM/ murein hydrolase activator NlpD